MRLQKTRQVLAVCTWQKAGPRDWAVAHPVRSIVLAATSLFGSFVLGQIISDSVKEMFITE